MSLSTKASDGAARLVGLLAHELRNPLASLQGCAITLQDRFEDLDPQLRVGLTQVVVNQSRKMDWLIGALAALGGIAPSSESDEVDPDAVVRAASETAGIEIDPHAQARFVGDGSKVRLALEALLLALSGGGATARGSLGPGVLEVASTAHDLERGGRAWKLALARRLLREEGCTLRVYRTTDGTKARVRFPRASTRRIA